VKLPGATRLLDPGRLETVSMSRTGDLKDAHVVAVGKMSDECLEEFFPPAIDAVVPGAWPPVSGAVL